MMSDVARRQRHLGVHAVEEPVRDLVGRRVADADRVSYGQRQMTKRAHAAHHVTCKLVYCSPRAATNCGATGPGRAHQTARHGCCRKTTLVEGGARSASTCGRSGSPSSTAWRLGFKFEPRVLIEVDPHLERPLAVLVLVPGGRSRRSTERIVQGARRARFRGFTQLCEPQLRCVAAHQTTASPRHAAAAAAVGRSSSAPAPGSRRRAARHNAAAEATPPLPVSSHFARRRGVQWRAAALLICADQGRRRGREGGRMKDDRVACEQRDHASASSSAEGGIARGRGELPSGTGSEGTLRTSSAAAAADDDDDDDETEVNPARFSRSLDRFIRDRRAAAADGGGGGGGCDDDDDDDDGRVGGGRRADEGGEAARHRWSVCNGLRRERARIKLAAGQAQRDGRVATGCRRRMLLSSEGKTSASVGACADHA